MKTVKTGNLTFRFEDALDAFVFDEKDATKSTFHGAPMKAVDVIAEFSNFYVYIEIKDYDDPSSYDIRRALKDEKIKKTKRLNWLKDYLKYKFRDSYLYRHAEQKVDKPVHYVCLNNFDSGLNYLIQKSLRFELPVGKLRSIIMLPARYYAWEKMYFGNQT